MQAAVPMAWEGRDSTQWGSHPEWQGAKVQRAASGGPPAPHCLPLQAPPGSWEPLFIHLFNTPTRPQGRSLGGQRRPHVQGASGQVNLRGTGQAGRVGQPEESHAGKEETCMRKSGPRGHCAGGELLGRPGDLGRGRRLGLPVQRGRVGPGDLLPQGGKRTGPSLKGRCTPARSPHVHQGSVLQGARAPLPATTCEPERAGEGLTGRQVSCLPTAPVGVCTQGHEAGLALGVSWPATGQIVHRSGSDSKARAALRPDALHQSWARGPLRISETEGTSPPCEFMDQLGTPRETSSAVSWSPLTTKWGKIQRQGLPGARGGEE